VKRNFISHRVLPFFSYYRKFRVVFLACKLF
ncbi:hypothetical protein Y032_1691g3942, partial [Ancylostoma ceylanicum]